MCFCSCWSRWRFLLLFLKRQSHWQEDIFLTFPLAYKKNQHQNSLLISGLFQKDYKTIIHISFKYHETIDRWVRVMSNSLYSFHTKLEIIEIEYHEYPDKLFLSLFTPCNWGVSVVCLRVIPLFLIVLIKWRQTRVTWIWVACEQKPLAC